MNAIDSLAADAAEDEDDDLALDDFLGEDEWEDESAYKEIIRKLPDGWSLIKVENYTAASLKEMDEWLAANCRGAYERVGWSSGCAFTVGVKFEDQIDAVYFRLRWTTSTF